jgi:hypothetical protein
MKRKLFSTLLLSGLKHFLTNIDFDQLVCTELTQQNASFTSHAFTQFALPLSLSKSSISTISSRYDDSIPAFILDFDGVLADATFLAVDPHSPTKSFHLPNSLATHFLGSAEIRILVRNIQFSIAPKFSVTIQSITFSWKVGLISFEINHIKISHEFLVICEKQRITGTWGSIFECNTDHLSVTIPTNSLSGIVPFVNYFRSAFFGREIEVIPLGEESDLSSPQTPTVYSISIGTCDLKFCGSQFHLSGIVWTDRLKIDRLLGQSFSLENLCYFNNNLTIQKLDSEYFRVIDPEIPFLVVSKGCGVLGSLEFSRTFSDFVNTVEPLTRTISGLAVLSSRQIMTLPELRLYLADDLIVSTEVILKFEEGKLNLLINNGSIRYGEAEPIMTSFGCVLSRDSQLIITPFSMRLTFDEFERLFFCFEEVLSCLSRILPFNLEIEMSNSGIVICEEVQKKRHDFLNISTYLLTIHIIPIENKMRAIMAGHSSIRFWNAKISSWDYILSPVRFHGTLNWGNARQVPTFECTFDAIHINLSSSFLRALKKQQIGNETIRIQNSTKTDLKLSIDNRFLVIGRNDIEITSEDPSSRITFLDIKKTIRISQIKTPLILDDNFIITPSNNEGGKRITVTSRYSFENTTHETLIVYSSDKVSTTIETIIPGEFCPLRKSQLICFFQLVFQISISFQNLGLN